MRLSAVLVVLCAAASALAKATEDPFANARNACAELSGDGTVCTFSITGATTSKCDCSRARPVGPKDPFADARETCKELSGDGTLCTFSITGATTSKCDCKTVKTLRGGGAKLPDAARVVHRWSPAVCKRANLGKACPLGITTFADGHAVVELLGIKLPQALGNAVARAVGRALPKGVADDVTPQEPAAALPVLARNINPN